MLVHLHAQCKHTFTSIGNLVKGNQRTQRKVHKRTQGEKAKLGIDNKSSSGLNQGYYSCEVALLTTVPPLKGPFGYSMLFNSKVLIRKSSLIRSYIDYLGSFRQTLKSLKLLFVLDWEMVQIHHNPPHQDKASDRINEDK